MPADTPKRRGRPPSGQRDSILRATREVILERGIARLTTREVAERAGVSEASIYYHFGDRSGLLDAVFERGIQPLWTLAEGDEIGQVLEGATATLESFFDEVLPILIAAQSDVELQERLRTHIRERDLGPHRGIALLGGYLREQQAAGLIAAEVDVDAAAFMLIATCFLRVAERQLMGQARSLPAREQVATTLDALLRATGSPAPR